MIFEFFKHLFYELPFNETIRSRLRVTNITNLIKDRTTLGQTFLFSKLVSSRIEEESNYD